MAVTDFKKYADCPYRFYLARVKGLRAVKHLPLELDGGAFGDLIHKILEDFHTSSVAASGDAAEVSKWLMDQLQLESQRRYGLVPPPAVIVQLEQARMRLQHFAPLQAAKIREGWRQSRARKRCGLSDR
jgi:RecB family exonuclease